MAHIYINDDTKTLLETVHRADRRTQEGEIKWLLERRAAELGLTEQDKSPRRGD